MFIIFDITSDKDLYHTSITCWYLFDAAKYTLNIRRLKRMKYKHHREIDQINRCSGLESALNILSRNTEYLDYFDIGKFKNLTILTCSFTGLRSLNGLHLLSNLHLLDCSHNKILNLSGIEYCINLEVLCCVNNYLLNVNELRSCTQLEVLHCNGNRIKNLKGLELCTKLRSIHCEYNNLASLKPLKNCKRLETIICYGNRFSKIRDFINNTPLIWILPFK